MNLACLHVVLRCIIVGYHDLSSWFRNSADGLLLRAAQSKPSTLSDRHGLSLQAYLASSSGESSDDAGEDAEAKQKRLRALLLGGDDRNAGAGNERALGRYGGKGWAAAPDAAANGAGSDDDASNASDKEVCSHIWQTLPSFAAACFLYF